MLNYLALGISLIVYGGLSILNYFGYFLINEIKSIAISLMLFGLISVVRSLNKLKRSSLLLISFVFNTGVLLYFLEQYEILNLYDIILAAVLYFIGGGFFLVFVENLKETRILIFASFFLLLSFLAIIFHDAVWLLKFANRVTLILFDFWPFLLIILGIVLVSGKKEILSRN